MAGLLVSVRSASEALMAVSGGASLIDVKEPTLGPLGRASASVHRDVRVAVEPSRPVSAALGELADWDHRAIDPLEGYSYRKLGLAGAGADWSARWASVRRLHPGPPWIAVVYSDWERAGAPGPDLVLDAAIGAEDCRGLLIDTWDKSRAGSLDLSWAPYLDRARAGGLLIALAGRLDLASIRRLAPLRPDLFAVRGAACELGDRLRSIDPRRVEALAEAAGPA